MFEGLSHTFRAQGLSVYVCTLKKVQYDDRFFSQEHPCATRANPFLNDFIKF